MASSLALKRLVSSNLFSNTLNPLRVASQPVSLCLFNTNAVREYDSDDRDYNVERQVANYRVFSPFSGHALMVSIGFLLKELAHEHNLSIVVTNHMVAGEAGSLKPALGESWKMIPHVRLMLSRQQHGNNVSHASVIKHPYLAGGRTMEFAIA